jgi:hypothetical protein
LAVHPKAQAASILALVAGLWAISQLGVASWIRGVIHWSDHQKWWVLKLYHYPDFGRVDDISPACYKGAFLN